MRNHGAACDCKRLPWARCGGRAARAAHLATWCAWPATWCASSLTNLVRVALPGSAARCGPLALTIAAMDQPTAHQVAAAREAAGLSQAQAAALVHTDARTWRRWELGPGYQSGRAMPLAAWELFLIKTGQRAR